MFRQSSLDCRNVSPVTPSSLYSSHTIEPLVHFFPNVPSLLVDTVYDGYRVHSTVDSELVPILLHLQKSSKRLYQPVFSRLTPIKSFRSIFLTSFEHIYKEGYPKRHFPSFIYTPQNKTTRQKINVRYLYIERKFRRPEGQKSSLHYRHLSLTRWFMTSCN